jgi:NADH-quinone oxidoreductase subunit H
MSGLSGLSSLSGGLTYAVELSYWQQTTLRSIGVLVAVLIPAGTLVYVFLFKMMSFMQSRLGPMEAGPWGSLQLLAEVGKFIQKEDIIPWRADRKLFALAPYVVIAAVFLIYLVVPFGPDAYFVNFDTGVFWVLAVSSISVIGILIAGWSSANKYSLLGGLRAAGQLIAYELPMVLAVVGVVIQAGTLNMKGIVAAQHEGTMWLPFIGDWGGLGNPFILTQIIGFLIFLIAMQAELTQTPFDMPVAESELVSGYMTEYSGLRFLLFFIGEFASAGAFAAVAATLFLGGWSLPGLDMNAGYMNVVGPIVVLAKMMIVAFLVFWVRFTYPRFREDQLQQLAWKVLIPLSLVNILATMALKVAF